MVHAVGGVARRVCVRRVVCLVRAWRVAVCVGAGGGGEERI